ncbi:SGT1 protein-domain-containing protein [Melanogaster broomeanus]|nr:SGT1 protein-domain-containing protein [Melanogaster broomeanus]
MDIFNRPPSISEDTLQYTLYPPLPLADKPSCTSLAACMHDLVSKLLPDLIWHRDPFQFKIVPDPDASVGEDKNVLEGRMRVGDCVDDEWCVVWLLREISKQWDVVISASDSDGEFLLIEAAESLPSWVNPSNATNRVWIYRGRLHLIPLVHFSAPNKARRRRSVSGAKDDKGHIVDDEDDDDYISVADAQPLVRDASVDTLAPKAVEDTVFQRISGYPTAARSHVHTTKAYLPVDIARALSVDPSLIQKPIETFYTRDAIQLRAAHKMARFPPRPNVLRSVKMTRTAYAQLLDFWPFEEREGTDAWRWRDVGMKVVSCFTHARQFNRSHASHRLLAEALKDALRRSPDYKAYLTRLITAGYFRNEVEGSQLWNELENKAANAYVEVRREDDASRPSFAALFNAALIHDSDEWMNIDEADLEDTLKRTMLGRDSSVTTQAMDDKLAKEQTGRLRDLADKVERFVEGEGDIEGARFEELDDDTSSDPDDEDSDDDNRELKEEARQQAMANLVPALPSSEYGQMPASFQYAASVSSAATAGTADTGSPPLTRPIRPPILPPDRYEGVDSDDESSSPQVVGDIEVDMNEEEAEFLEFSRQALGISDQMWGDIINERRGRGAFVPASVTTEKTPISSAPVPTEEAAKQNSGQEAAPDKFRTPAPGPRPKANPNLDSFETVMQAMDAELSRETKTFTSTTAANGQGQRKAPAVPMNANVDMDIEASMDAELKALLEQGETGDSDEEDGEPSMDYNLIKNFLESFKSQAGLSGPVGNLAGRLNPGWTLPRDDS